MNGQETYVGSVRVHHLWDRTQRSVVGWGGGGVSPPLLFLLIVIAVNKFVERALRKQDMILWSVQNTQ